MFDNIGPAELLVIAMIGLFVLGPERLPEAAAWVARTVRSIKEYATGARDQLRQDLGPEFDELRRPFDDLRSVRDLDPRAAVRRQLFADPPADGSWSGAPTPATPDPAVGDAAGAVGPSGAGRSENGHPAGGVDAPLKGRSDRAIPLAPGESAPWDADAT